MANVTRDYGTDDHRQTPDDSRAWHVADGPAAVTALQDAELTVVACREVLTLRLDQDEPGQLGKLTAALAAAAVNVEVLYSDRDGRLVLLSTTPLAAAASATSGVPHATGRG